MCPPVRLVTRSSSWHCTEGQPAILKVKVKSHGHRKELKYRERRYSRLHNKNGERDAFNSNDSSDNDLSYHREEEEYHNRRLHPHTHHRHPRQHQVEHSYENSKHENSPIEHHRHLHQNHHDHKHNFHNNNTNNNRDDYIKYKPNMPPEEISAKEMCTQETSQSIRTTALQDHPDLGQKLSQDSNSSGNTRTPGRRCRRLGQSDAPNLSFLLTSLAEDTLSSPTNMASNEWEHATANAGHIAYSNVVENTSDNTASASLDLHETNGRYMHITTENVRALKPFDLGQLESDILHNNLDCSKGYYIADSSCSGNVTTATYGDSFADKEILTCITCQQKDEMQPRTTGVSIIHSGTVPLPTKTIENTKPTSDNVTSRIKKNTAQKSSKSSTKRRAATKKSTTTSTSTGESDFDFEINNHHQANHNDMSHYYNSSFHLDYSSSFPVLPVVDVDTISVSIDGNDQGSMTPSMCQGSNDHDDGLVEIDNVPMGAGDLESVKTDANSNCLTNLWNRQHHLSDLGKNGGNRSDLRGGGGGIIMEEEDEAEVEFAIANIGVYEENPNSVKALECSVIDLNSGNETETKRQDSHL